MLHFMLIIHLLQGKRGGGRENLSLKSLLICLWNLGGGTQLILELILDISYISYYIAHIRYCLITQNCLHNAFIMFQACIMY